MGILFFMQEKLHRKEEITFSDPDSQDCQKIHTSNPIIQQSQPNPAHEIISIKHPQENNRLVSCSYGQPIENNQQKKIINNENGMHDLEQQVPQANKINKQMIIDKASDINQEDFNGEIPKQKNSFYEEEETKQIQQHDKNFLTVSLVPVEQKEEKKSHETYQDKEKNQNTQQNIKINDERQPRYQNKQIGLQQVNTNKQNQMKDLELNENDAVKQPENQMQIDTNNQQVINENKQQQLEGNVEQLQKKISISQDQGNSALLTTQMIKKKKEVEVINLEDQEGNKINDQEQQLKQIQPSQMNQRKDDILQQSNEKPITEKSIQINDAGKNVENAPPTLKPHPVRSDNKKPLELEVPTLNPVHKVVISPQKSGAKITFVSNTNFIYFEVFEPLTNRYFNAYITNEQVEEFEKKLVSKSGKKVSLFKDLAQFYQYLYTTTSFLLKAPGQINEKDRRLSSFIQVDHSEMLLKIHIQEEKDFDNLIFTTKIREIGKESIQVEFNQRTLQLNAKTNQFIKNVKDLQHRVYDLQKYKKDRANSQASIDPQKLKKYLFDFHTRLTDSHSQVQALKQETNQLKNVIQELKTKESYQQINSDFYEQLKTMHKNMSFLILRSGFGDIAQQTGTDYSLQRCARYQWSFQNDPEFYEISFNKETQEFQAQGMADEITQTQQGGKPTTWKCVTVTNSFSDSEPIIYLSIKIMKIANKQKNFGFQLGIRNQTWASCTPEQCCKNIIVYESGGPKSHGKVWNSKQWEKVSICTAHCRKVCEGDILTGILDRRDAHYHKFAWYKNNTKLVEVKLPIQMRSEKIYPLLGLWGPGDRIKIV